MASSDYHLNILLAFENRDENQLPVVPPDKLEELKRRFVNSAISEPPCSRSATALASLLQA